MAIEDKFFISEFDSAKQSTLWAAYGQDFYAITKIIDEEFDEAMNWMWNGNGKVAPLKVVERRHGRIAATYCMALALELVIKAAYIQEIGIKEMKPNENAGFTNHKISDLVQKITRVELCDEELKEVKKAEEIIIFGKYPAPKKPSDTKHYWQIPSLKRTIEKLEPIYLKYTSCVSKYQKNNNV